jgi:hypothetical protein
MWFTKESVKEVKIIDDSRIKELERELREYKADVASERRIAEREYESKVEKAVADKQKEINKLAQENAVLKNENSILTKAFENMGFDVKDMKEILGKLVDGIVSKNTINVVK